MDGKSFSEKPPTLDLLLFRVLSGFATASFLFASSGELGSKGFIRVVGPELDEELSCRIQSLLECCLGASRAQRPGSLLTCNAGASCSLLAA
jgi:hypothetical protein